MIETREKSRRNLGTIKFFRDEDGWGFITLDDPLYDGDAWFHRRDVLSHSSATAFQFGDRVTCLVESSEPGRWRATEVVEVLSRSRYKVPSGRLIPSREAETRDEQVTQPESDAQDSETELADSNASEALVEAGVIVIAEEVRAILMTRQPQEMPFTTLGAVLKRRITNFDNYRGEFRSFKALIERVCLADAGLTVGQYENGHPFIRLDE